MGYHAEIGVTIDEPTAIVNDVEPWNRGAGIGEGDRVGLDAMPFRERGYHMKPAYRSIAFAKRCVERTTRNV